MQSYGGSVCLDRESAGKNHLLGKKWVKNLEIMWLKLIRWATFSQTVSAPEMKIIPTIKNFHYKLFSCFELLLPRICILCLNYGNGYK